MSNEQTPAPAATGSQANPASPPRQAATTAVAPQPGAPPAAEAASAEAAAAISKTGDAGAAAPNTAAQESPSPGTGQTGPGPADPASPAPAEATAADPSSQGGPAPQPGRPRLFGRLLKHRDGRRGMLASIRRDEEGRIVAARLQIGPRLTDWIAPGELADAE